MRIHEELLELDRQDLPKQLSRIYKFFAQGQRKYIADTFYNALEVIYFRFRRKYKIWKKKPKNIAKNINAFNLSKLDVTSALILIDHFANNCYFLPPESNPLEKFGSFPSSDAIRYFEEFVVGNVNDVHGRKIEIPAESFDFLFDHDKSLPEQKYVESKAKHMPWIKTTLKNSYAIYEYTEKSWTTYYYISCFNVPYTEMSTQEIKKIKHYYFIVIRHKRNESLKFITAYSFDKERMFLKYLEPSHPYIATK